MSNADVSNLDVAVYALYKLGGHQKKVHTEEIAYEAYKLSKERFGWKLPKFRKLDLPDKEVARIALIDAAKEKYGCLVEGRSGVESRGKDTDGWLITPIGVAWILENKNRIEKALRISKAQIRKIEAERFKRQISMQRLFKKYQEQKTLIGESQYELTDLLNTSPDAPKEVIQAKFSRLKAIAMMVGDSVFVDFLDECREAFPELLKLNE